MANHNSLRSRIREALSAGRQKDIKDGDVTLIMPITNEATGHPELRSVDDLHALPLHHQEQELSIHTILTSPFPASAVGDFERLDVEDDIEAEGDDVEQAIHIAAEDGDFDQVRSLIDEDSVLLKARDVDWWTPLHYAAFQGHAEIVALLLDKGANPESRDTLGLTPSDLAMRQRHSSAANLLRP